MKKIRNALSIAAGVLLLGASIHGQTLPSDHSPQPVEPESRTIATPVRRPHRTVMSRTRAGLPGLTRIPEANRIRVTIPEDLDPATVQPGQTMLLPIEADSNDFGTLSTLSSFSEGSSVEIQVVAVKRPQRNESGRVVFPGHVLFRPKYLVLPVDELNEKAVPISAMLLKPNDYNSVESSHDVANRMQSAGSAIGQLVGGVPGYFYGGAISWLAGHSAASAQKNSHSYCKGKLPKGTVADVVITRGAYF